MSKGEEHSPSSKETTMTTAKPPAHHLSKHHDLLQKLSLESKKLFKEELKKFKEQQSEEREKLTLLKSPVRTLWYCLMELKLKVSQLCSHLVQKRLFLTVFIVGLIMSLASLIFTWKFICKEHHHLTRNREMISNIDSFCNNLRISFIEPYNVESIMSYSIIALEWLVLGVLSSIGLGSGLHTFLLYLGPFIAKVTIACTECNSCNFAKYGANSFTCPSTATQGTSMTFWEIVSNVEYEALFWGLGTAIGEIPPFLIARAARKSGSSLESLEDENYDSDEEELSDKKEAPTGISKIWNEWMDWFKSKVETVVESNYTFFFILAMASIPNPLFDLAGLTCGFYLVPFWVFFLATVIGKSIIKANLQTLLIVAIFRKEQLEKIVNFVEDLKLPFIQGKVKAFFENERAKFHPDAIKQATTESSKSILSTIWDFVLILMISWFFVSIVNSTAQGCLMEQQKTALEQFKEQRLHELIKSEQKEKK
ncbi:hypothetical protein C9374_003361 [Naegleria lovaniensis]|uniref:Vacuole membrane protein 1 n=1 Tax=Naegleria lovaniensis TaxID=51637 RepID=A0AA88GNT6_NAELO|nr:uncharacterized protein C9374_003361 [Naegleria lovaniensis]KAG2385546.1 hypothetical protein C9374_003361 [Naegleria lovaniensis]